MAYIQIICYCVALISVGHLAKLFTGMLRHVHKSDYILEAVISSIPKNNKGDIN